MYIRNTIGSYHSCFPGTVIVTFVTTYGDEAKQSIACAILLLARRLLTKLESVMIPLFYIWKSKIREGDYWV